MLTRTRNNHYQDNALFTDYFLCQHSAAVTSIFIQLPLLSNHGNIQIWVADSFSMGCDQDGPLNVGLKLSLQDSLNFVYNFDIAKSRHLVYGGFCFGFYPVHGGCLFALDTTRNCIEKEETRFIAGLTAAPGKTKPWSSPPFFHVFNFLGVQRRRPGADISLTASKKLDEKLSAGIALGLDTRGGGDPPSLAGFASYEVDEDTTASFYVNRHLSFGVGITRQLNAFHSASLLALLDPGRGLRLGFNVDYRPEPPLMLRIKYKMKEWKRDGVRIGGGGGGGGGAGSDQELLALQQRLEEEARRTLGAAKKTLDDVKNSWNDFVNRS